MKKFDYTLVKSELSWQEAADACSSKQAQLAKLDSKLKNDLAMEKLRSFNERETGAWFGASRDPNANNNWIYTDGSAVDYTNWGPGRGKLLINKNIPNIELVLHQNMSIRVNDTLNRLVHFIIQITSTLLQIKQNL